MIRPAYWTDADLHTRLTADVREFYIGCWMQADDDGYFPWDVDRIGADLYPFRSLSWRRSHIVKWAELLSGHVRLLDCGKHAVVPNLPKYQSPPKPTSQHRKAHDACVRAATPHGATGDQVGPHGTSTGREGKGRELNGGGRPPADETETSEFRRLVPRPVALGGKAS
jgi:hypothetical protein